METLNSANRQSIGLPPINQLEADKVKRGREEAEYQRKHSAPAMVSPLHPFPGPLHSYSNHQSSPASSLPGPSGGLLSPPESRRTSGDEKDQRPQARQSLPSIHEALGPEPPLPYTQHPPSAPASVPPSFFPSSSSSATSPADPRTRTFSVDHINNQGPPNPFAQPRSPFINNPASTAPPPPSTHSSADALIRPSFPPSQSNPKLPALHPLKTTQSPTVPASRPNPPYTAYSHPPSSTTYEPSAPHSAGPMNPQYGYQPYPSDYPVSAPAPSGPSSRYPPPGTYSAPPQYSHPPWRPDNPEFGRTEEKKRSIGEKVKRQLDSFDLEVSLNEMADGAGRVADFSKTYGQRAHQNQRIGLSPQSIPRLEEVEEMIKHGQKMLSALVNMRDLVYNHQQASLAEPSREAHYRPVNGYDPEGHQNAFHEDPKANAAFSGMDPNKRHKRGRAAPPGRCHSCNRAETPEWRRGPDGARTLCNACGLHYAKLTRKMAGGKQALASSNLRPKTVGEGSSAA